MKILIVDDNDTNLKLLRVVLEAKGCEVLQAADGLEALVALKCGTVDAIISDILMPRMDGYRFCQEVRKSKRLREIPFLFYTATYTSPGDEKLCYDLGADNYLRKPIAAETLIMAVKDAVNSPNRRQFNPISLLSESDVMKEYNQRLVSKLEEKNHELEEARKELELANQDLDCRVQQRTAELKIANDELESFAYSVSHDLQAPLNHIGGFVDIVMRDCTGQIDETSLQYLEKTRAAAHRMGDLIAALLDLSQVGRIEMRRCPVDLSAMAAELFAELQQAEPSRVVIFEIAPDLMANGDPLLLRIVLANLFENAWKYTRKRPEARIEFGKREDEDGYTYFVRDNGAGFDMAYVSRLFGAFQRLHSSHEFEGTGVGLATVKRVIRRHNGNVWAESIGCQGATFYFTLGEDVAEISNDEVPPTN